MDLNAISPGKNIPHDVNVIVEIPANSHPIKYEVDKDSGAIFVDRFMATYMQYPCNYGYIPQSLSEDGDPLDVLLITPYPVNSGAVVRCRPIGMLKMTDEAGPDDKILAVPIKEVCALYRKINQVQDLPELQLLQITHFFKHYKDLEKNKWVEMGDWVSAQAAEQEIKVSIQRHQDHKTS